jgi:hypothetical protein
VSERDCTRCHGHPTQEVPRSQRSRRQHARSAQGEARPCAGMPTVTAQAAGVASGAQEIVACGPDGEAQQIVRTLGTSTAALQHRAAWLVDHGLETVARASTGVAWRPLGAAWEAPGLRCWVMRARSITRVPGRKRAGVACQWLPPFQSEG